MFFLCGRAKKYALRVSVVETHTSDEQWNWITLTQATIVMVYPAYLMTAIGAVKLTRQLTR